MGSYRPSSYIIAKRMAAVIAMTVTVIIAQCSRVTSMITPANRNAAVIIVNRRCDHEFVIIAPVIILWLSHWVGVIFSVGRTDISRTTTLSSVCAILSVILVLPLAVVSFTLYLV